MIKSDSTKEIFAALAKAQGEIKNAAFNAENPAFKRGGKVSEYADLSAVLNQIRPVFSKNGLSIIQSPSFADGMVMVETMVAHESGEWICDISRSPVTKQDAQGIGSVTTYLRRYAAQAFAGITQEGEDDDGATGSGPEKISDEQFAKLNELVSASGADVKAFCNHLKIAKLEDLSVQAYSTAEGLLLAKLKKVQK